MNIQQLLKDAKERYNSLNDSQKLRMWYEQRRSFAKGMASDKAGYERHVAMVNKLMPPEEQLTDAQIGLILVGQYNAN